MKKTIGLVFLCVVLAIPMAVSAQGYQGGQGTMQQNRVQDPVRTVTTTPQGNQVQNQNQVTTQNQGEDSQLEVKTQEVESLGEGQEDEQGGDLQNRNQNAVQNMSEVAKQVQQMLQVRTEGGIGDQVRQIAQEQNQAQTRIQEQLNKLASKGKLARLLTGTDYGALKNLKAQVVQNQLQIEQLTQLQTQLATWQDAVTVQEAIQALMQENISLQERIAVEEQTKSMFGWLLRFLSK